MLLTIILWNRCSKSSLDKSQIRAIIYYEWKNNTSTNETVSKLNEVLGEGTMQLRTVQNWFKKFNSGDFSLEDKERSGRPKELEDYQIMDLLERNRSISAKQIASELNISDTAIRNRLKALGFTCKLDKWVPHQLSEKNKLDRIEICSRLLERNRNDPFLDRIVTCDEKWIYHDNITRRRSWSLKGEPPQKIGKRNLTRNKVLLCIWWDSRGIICQEFLKSGETINSDVYCDMLRRVHAIMKENRSSLINRKQVIFHQDNARPHKSMKTLKVIQELNWTLMEHPPYSPDIAPSDFYLFRVLQNHLMGKNFKSSEGIKNEVLSFFHSKGPDFFNTGINKLLNRWEAVIEKDGEYLDD